LLKVVLFGPYPVDEQFTEGGVQKVTHNLVEGLRQRDDLDLHVVSLSNVPADSTHKSGPVTIHHLKRQRRLCLPTFSFLSVQKARRYIRSLAPQIVHCQEAGLESYIAAPLPFPTLVTVHAIFQNEGKYYPVLRSRLRYRQVEFMARQALAGIDLYVPSSIYARDELQDRVGKLHDVIENPIEQRYFTVSAAEVPGRLLFAGTVYPRKGIDVLIEAVKLLKEASVPFTLNLTGGVKDQNYYQRLLKMVQDYDLGETVKFKGLVAEAELENQFGQAAIVVLPSFAETSPMTVQQAMAAGKPVVATTVGGIPYLIEDGVSGRLLAPGDPEALAAALQDLLTDDAMRSTMGKRARQEAAARFSAAEVAARTVAVYHQILADKEAA
jgi:glycosyltransferase involved in cell wall biosynthesis